ncbi:hypothetical protein POTOM_037169 [Populus tomentosa]|uniref:DUF4283 domain-containing protein n=1 Tax=Populus tomentosa TaxID=118781 RepID=A0A8X8CJU1_POPTO|nr:hypothetical protein POTOM_037169 [Populus tomentosa]
MNSIAHKIWKRFGLDDVTSLTNGFTMLRFKTEDELQKVIENDPWMFGEKAIIFQKLHYGFAFDMNKITKIPVWIRIYDVPFSLWTKEGLSEGKGNAITSPKIDTNEISSKDSNSSAETDIDSLDKTDTEESASDSSTKSQLKPSDLRDVNLITLVSINDHMDSICTSRATSSAAQEASVEESTSSVHPNVSHLHSPPPTLTTVKKKKGAIKDIFPNTITEASKAATFTPITDDDIKEALFSIPDSKASGPNEADSSVSVLSKEFVSVSAEEFESLEDISFVSISGEVRHYLYLDD